MIKLNMIFLGIMLALFGPISAFAEVVQPDELILEGDQQVGVNDPLKITAKFNGTFSSVSYVQITFYLNDYYTYGESYKLTFFDDSNNVAYTLSHNNTDPVNLNTHLGLLTTNGTVEAQFSDGQAVFELVMLSGSVNVSSIVVNVSGTFIPTPPVADGDINQDMVVNAADVLLVQRIVLNSLVPTALQLQHADVAPVGAPDGQINAADYLLIIRKALGENVGL